LAISPKIGGLVHAWLGVESPGLHVCILGTFTLCWVIFEVASIIANTIFGGLVNDVVPQALMGRFFGLFRMVTVLDGVLFNYFIIKHAEEHFFWIYVGTGLFYAVGFTIMCLKVKEGQYAPVELVGAADPHGKIEALKAYFRECYSKPYYLWIFGGIIFGTMSFEPVHSFSIFYAKSMGMSVESYGKFLATSYMVSFISSYVIGSLADRFHPLRMGMISLAIYLPVTFAGAMWGTNADRFGWAFLIHMIVSGIYYASVASLGQRLYPKMKFAQFASAAFLLQSILRALLPPGIGLVLDFSGHHYRLTFVASGMLATVGLISMGMAYRKFQRLGGTRDYTAP
jgi:hypothetical protein